MADLTTLGVYDALKRFFPSRNDDFASDYVEELNELRDFGVTQGEQLVDLLQRRCAEVIEIDQSPMNEAEIRMWTEDCGEKFVADRLRDGYWFSYPALFRIALELEYGATYRAYADRRDGLEETDPVSSL